MGNIKTWTMENHLPSTSPTETNSLFYAMDVVRYMRFRSSFSIKYCHQGSIRYLVENQAVDVPAGSFFIVNDGTELECLPCQPGTEAVAVFFSKDLLRDVQRTIGEDEKTLLDAPRFQTGELRFFEHVYQKPAALYAQLNDILRHFTASPGNLHDCPPDLFFSLAENLFGFQRQTHCQINAIKARSTPTKQELYRRVLAARSFMFDQWDAPLNLQEVARHACLSPYHFHRSFMQAFGETPMGWFKKMKLERAKALLASGSHGVTEVAQCCGFSDLASFSKAFKKSLGDCPSRFAGARRGISPLLKQPIHC